MLNISISVTVAFCWLANFLGRECRMLARDITRPIHIFRQGVYRTDGA